MILYFPCVSSCKDTPLHIAQMHMPQKVVRQICSKKKNAKYGSQQADYNPYGDYVRYSIHFITVYLVFNMYHIAYCVGHSLLFYYFYCFPSTQFSFSRQTLLYFMPLFGYYRHYSTSWEVGVITYQRSISKIKYSSSRTISSL